MKGCGTYGAAEAVPFQNPSNQSFLLALDGVSPVSTRLFPQPVKPRPFKANSNLLLFLLVIFLGGHRGFR
jgi:hypothetical protein